MKIVKQIPYYNQLVQPLHFAKAFHAASKNNYPATAMKVIGVTGTNGKTTTTWMIYSVLREKFGNKVGIMSTIGWGPIDGKIQDQTAHATTENPAVLQQHIAKLRDAGIEYLVLEVSSHALAQHRVFGIPFDAAVFTNLSPDHLDYHKTMLKYREAKEKLFHLVAKNHNGKKLGVINGDDPVGKFFARDVPHFAKYGLSEGERGRSNDIFAKSVKLSADGVEYNLCMSPDFAKNLSANNDNFAKKYATEAARAKNLAIHIKTQIPGEFNVYNSLAAATIGLNYGLSRKEVETGIASLSGVAGRMNSIDEGQNFSVIIDFATTPDAFANVLPNIRETTKGKVITLFGLPGMRDQTKASGMGEVAAKYSDKIILTEDDARGNVRSQSEKIAKGIKDKSKIEFIDNRTDAIEAAIKFAKKGDTVVLLGKGPEKMIARKIGDKIVDQPWDEDATARKALVELKKKSATIVSKPRKVSSKLNNKEEK